MKTKILLDTDIGTDIDDAVCLAYLLANPKCELLGITTSTGEAVKRAMMASAICRHAGKDIPIFPGADNPMFIKQNQLVAQQAELLYRWDHQSEFPRGQAVEFLRSTIRKHPGEITLLTIGPLTNIGLLFLVDPEIPSLLKGLTMMCGYFFGEIPDQDTLEWNAIGDYHATSIVYKAEINNHRSVGLDVTHKVKMSEQEFRAAFTSQLFTPVHDFSKVWFEKFYDHTVFHDPLAAAVIFKNDLCTFEKGHIEIDMYNEKTLGMTRFTKTKSGKHETATSVDCPKFFEHFCATINNQ